MYITEISKVSYQQFIDTSKHSTVFHTTPWLDIISEVYGSTIRYLGVIAGDELLGAFPVMCKRVGFLTLHGSPLSKHATHISHPVLDDRIESTAFFDALQRWVNAQHLAFFQLAWTGPVPAQSARCRVESRATLVVPLEATLEEIWKRIKPEARNRIRRAVRAGIKLHWCQPSHFLQLYHDLLQSTYARQGITPNFPPILYTYLLQHRAHLPLKLITATLHGKLIAALWLLYDHTTCYFWDGASDQSYRKLSANHLLHWAVMRWAYKNKRVAYDLIGTGSRSGEREGLGRFKRNLGAFPLDYSMIYWTQGWVWFLLNVYRWYLSMTDKPKT